MASWNNHRMRPNPKINSEGGRPVLLYTLPELNGDEDKLVEVDMHEVEVCRTESTCKRSIPCDRDIFDLACILMEENGWNAPNNGYQAASLYIRLRRQIKHDLNLG